jgi:DNA-binding phage protein
MNDKQKILTTLKATAIVAFGSENCYAIQKATGLSWKQINTIFDENRNPGINSILKYADAVNVKIESHAQNLQQ